jgi:hypothetical protein
MAKRKTLLVFGLAVLLGLVGVLSVLAGRGSGAVAVANNGLTVPAANMPLAANFKARPAAGAPVSLAWANTKVNTDSSIEAQNEPFIAINPSNPQHIVVGANNWLVGNGHFEVSAYVTFDGGQTWASSHPYFDRNASRLNAADPTIAFGADGTVYFAFVAMTPADGAVAVSRSLDGGLTWSFQSWATPFTSGADKPAIAFANGKLHLFYQNSALYSRVSADGGSTWGTANRIEFGGRNAAPVVTADGVVVFYNTASAIKMARPTAKNGAGYTISTVAATTPLQPRPTQYRANIYPAAGVDAKGNLYVAWADGRNVGRGNDILFSRSSNGSSWSAPVTLNTDNTSVDQLMPALAVSKDGAVTVAWLDNRNDAANINYDVYMARSTDGITFGANQRVTNVSSNPYNDPRTQGSMIGDYFALAASGDAVYPVWADTRNNNEDIFMARIPVGNLR